MHDGNHPRIDLEGDQQSIEMYAHYWDERGCKTHRKLVKWLRNAQAAAMEPNLARRIGLCFEALADLEELSLIEFPAREDDLFFTWSETCGRLSERLSRDTANWVGEADDLCWNRAMAASDFAGAERALRTMDEATELWPEGFVSPVTRAAEDRLNGRWEQLRKALDLRQLDTECLADVRNTKGRVKQRTISKRMVKHLEKVAGSDLPVVVKMWLSNRLDYWRTQMALVSD